MEKTINKVTWQQRQGGLYHWRPVIHALDLGIIKATIQIENEGDVGYTIYINGVREYKCGRLIEDIDGAKRIAENSMRDKLTEGLDILKAMGGE